MRQHRQGLWTGFALLWLGVIPAMVSAQIPSLQPRPASGLPSTTQNPASAVPANPANFGARPAATGTTPAATGQGASNWQSRGTAGVAGNPAAGQANRPKAVTHIAKVTSGIAELPRTAGQVWRAYDISPFTKRFPAESRPQQEIIDWILRETGTDLWFN